MARFAAPAGRPIFAAGMHILGISAFFHDSAACLLSDGRIVAAAQEERFSRRKGDGSFPRHAVQYCLAAAGMGPGELAAVGFFDKPLRKLERVLETHLSVAPAGFRSFLRAGPVRVGEQLFVERRLRRALDYRGPVLFAEHHESHAASAFFPSPFEEAAILTVDGAGEWTTAAIGVGRGADLELLRELRWPDSLGLLYATFTAYLGFTVNADESKVMELAAHGRPEYVRLILEQVVDLHDDGSFRLNRRYFDYLSGLTLTSPAFHRLFGGPPRTPGATITPRDQDLACSIQAVCEEIVLRMAREAHRLTGLGNLCLAGGVALNCAANGRLLREGPFQDLWIQPAAGDAGGSLGVAQLIWHRHFGRGRVAAPADSMSGALLGPSFYTGEIERALARCGARFERLDDAALLRRVAALLAADQVVAWFDGRMEFGPSALGGRSLLSDPRSPRPRVRINDAVKRRDGFRPLASSVLRERVADYFELDRESPYMLLAAPVKAERQDIPAVTPVDRSARIQTVERHLNPRFHALLREFERLTGCGVLGNTSFNVSDQPIVCTPEDAYRCFMGTDLDCLVMGPFLLEKVAQPAGREAAPAPAPRGAAARRAVRSAIGAWRVLARAGARVANPVLLGVVYFGVLWPVGWGLRLLGRDPLRVPAAGVTWWRTRAPGAGRSDLARQF